MTLGIFSDTHHETEYARQAIDMLLERGAEYLIHAGDIGREEILAYMADRGVPYAAVLGNTDGALGALRDRYALFSEPHYFSIEHLRIKLMHHPYFMSADADLVIYGHLHRFSASVREGALFLNPGEVCARNKPVSEAVVLKVREGAWEVIRCQRGVKEPVWQYYRKIYERVPA